MEGTRTRKVSKFLPNSKWRNENEDHFENLKISNFTLSLSEVTWWLWLSQVIGMPCWCNSLALTTRHNEFRVCVSRKRLKLECWPLFGIRLATVIATEEFLSIVTAYYSLSSREKRPYHLIQCWQHLKLTAGHILFAALINVFTVRSLLR